MFLHCVLTLLLMLYSGLYASPPLTNRAGLVLVCLMAARVLYEDISTEISRISEDQSEKKSSLPCGEQSTA